MKSGFNDEIYFLATIYMKPDLVKQIVIPIECIENGLNRFVLQAFIYTYNQHQTIDVASLLKENERAFEGKYTKQDFMQVITEINDVAENYVIEDFDYYQHLLFESYKGRLLRDTIKNFSNSQLTNEEFLHTIHQIEAKAIDTNTGVKTMDEIKELVTTNNKTINLRLERLSARVKLQEHSLTVISARTGVGKSGFALNILEDLSKTYKCIYFNMEMSEPSVYRRLTSIMSSVPMDMLSNPQTDYQAGVIEESIKNLSKRNMKIITGGQTIQSIRRRIIEEQKNEHLIVFIDYVGLVGSIEKHKSLYELVTSIVKELRSISMSYNCTIFLLAQINRSGEDNPKLSDLKESGELEQSATQVIILNGIETKQDEQEIIVDIAKNREGKTGKTKLLYNRSNQRFREEYYQWKKQFKFIY